MQWLRGFAALALLCGVVATLLPEGGIRKTAALVMGLMLTLAWVDSLCELPVWPESLPHPGSLLTETSADTGGAMAAYAQQLSQTVSESCGAPVQVELDAIGRVSAIRLPEDCSEETRRLCCEALGINEVFGR